MKEQGFVGVDQELVEAQPDARNAGYEGGQPVHATGNLVNFGFHGFHHYHLKKAFDVARRPAVSQATQAQLLIASRTVRKKRNGNLPG